MRKLLTASIAALAFARAGPLETASWRDIAEAVVEQVRPVRLGAAGNRDWSRSTTQTAAGLWIAAAGS